MTHAATSGIDIEFYVVSYEHRRWPRASSLIRKETIKKRGLKYGKNRNGFSSLKENWTGSTG